MTGKLDRKVVMFAAAAFVAGWLLGAQGEAIPNPFKPEPDRPFLRFVARVAKFGLWVMMAAERPPETNHGHYARVNPNTISHREGW